MFSRTIKRLLTNQFICNVSSPDEFRWLQEPDNFEEAAIYLERLNYKISIIPSNTAFYASNLVIDKDASRDINENFKQTKTETRDVVQWIALVLNATGSDKSLIEGQIIKTSDIEVALELNSFEKEKLFKFNCILSSKDTTIRGRLDKLMRRMEQWGYLIEVDKASSIFQVTGKISYHYQIVDFIIAHEGINIEQNTEELIQDKNFHQESMF